MISCCDSDSILVADVGGTNARLGVVTSREEHYEVTHEQVFRCDDLSRFEDVLEIYLGSLPCCPGRACLAVAGPVKDNAVAMTNLPWRIDGSELQKRYGFSKVDVINDFTAQAMAIEALSEDQLLTVCGGDTGSQCKADVNRVVIGPGTGLGVASLMKVQGSWYPISGEGGHVTLPVCDAYEAQLLQQLCQTLALEYISAETLLCGSGLRTLYCSLSRMEGAEPRDYTSEEITRLYTREPMLEKTLRVFLLLLANAASNMALNVGAQGGVFLTGGILPHISDLLIDGGFAARFREAGAMSHYLKDVPVKLVTAEYPALLGAAVWSTNHAETIDEFVVTI